MIVSHVISSIDKSSGGPSRSITHLISRLLKTTKIQICLNALKSSQPVIKKLEGSGSILFHDKNFFGFSKSLKNALADNTVQLLHGHGIWQIPVHQMAKQARKLNIPYIITPRGMLEPWSLSQSRIKKIIALKLYQHKDLKLSSCIHATALSEAENIRALGYKNPIAIISNGINIEEFPIYKKTSKSQKKLLFLSRIHEKKGIELLINAWKKLDRSITKNWQVEIVGNGDAKYIKELEQIICNLKLEQCITLSGPVFGEAKQLKYREADLFVLPTYSENFGIVIAEALASMVPVITTKGTPWEELNINNCGDWIDIGLEPLKASLSKMLSKSDDELLKMGKRGRQLIEEKYSIDAVASDMLLLYEWLVNKHVKPKFII